MQPVYECVDAADSIVHVVESEDRTNNRGKWISLNSGFTESVLHKRCIGVEIAVVVSRRVSLSWLLKVCMVENLRLNCLLVCGDSASRRRGWFQCLSQILSVAVWLGCRCCWRRPMIWTYWLQRLDDRYPGCAVLWLTGDVSKWHWSVGASPSRKLLVDWILQMLVADAVWSMSRFVQSLVNRVLYTEIHSNLLIHSKLTH